MKKTWKIITIILTTTTTIQYQPYIESTTNNVWKKNQLQMRQRQPSGQTRNGGWGRLWRGNIFFNYNVIHIFATFSHSLPFTSLTPSFLQSKQVLLVEHTPKPNNNHPKYNREWKEVKKKHHHHQLEILYFCLG